MTNSHAPEGDNKKFSLLKAQVEAESIWQILVERNSPPPSAPAGTEASRFCESCDERAADAAPVCSECGGSSFVTEWGHWYEGRWYHDGEYEADRARWVAGQERNKNICAVVGLQVLGADRKLFDALLLEGAAESGRDRE